MRPQDIVILLKILCFGVIAGGKLNCIDNSGVPGVGSYSIIGAGEANTLCADHGVITGGYKNSICSNTSVIAGGASNAIKTGACSVFIGGGDNNVAGCCRATLSGGSSNCVYGENATIGGGFCNQIVANCNAVVAGGYCNNIIDGGSWVCNGNVIGGGSNNKINCNNHNVIAGGFGSCITSSINGGGTAMNSVNCSIIGGGACHILAEVTNYSGIFTGLRNSAKGNFNVIAGGCCQSIGTGSGANSLNGGFIGTGCANKVMNGGCNSVINGSYNFVCSGVASWIGNGSCNCTTANCNFIGTGYNNKLTAASSVVLGGSNNCDGGEANMAIYGNGITASAIPGGLGAVWAHEVVLKDIPSGTCVPGGPIIPPTSYPTGSLWYYTDPVTLLKNVYVI